MRVPRLLHRIWLGSPIPTWAEEFWSGWRRLHPDWTLHTWCETNLPPLRNQTLYDDAEHLTAGNVWQLRSDIVRYELLWLYGGVYVDCDMEPLRSIAPILEGIDAFAAWERQDVWVNNAILGAAPRHAFVGGLVDGVGASVRANRDRRPNHATGPRYVTALYRQRPSDLHVFPEALFYPYSWSQLERRGESFPEAYTIHHWNNQRTLRGVS